MIQKIYNSKGFQTALPWIILLLGGLSLSYGTFGTFRNDNWSEFYKTLGKSFLIGGIFGVLLKSMQFLGIFKDELVKIIYEPKYLANRIDLPEMWQKMSMVLFKNKFPKISDQLLNDVKEIYFPTKEISYYENNEHQLEIRIIDKAAKLIKVTDTATLNVISESKNTKASYLFGQSKETADYKLIKFSVDEDTNPKTTKEEREINGKKYEVVIANLEGKEKYSIEKCAERIMDLSDDNIFGFHAKKMLHTLKIQFHFDENVEISLMKAGTLREFILKKSNATFKEYHYDGLIYPEQGYKFSVIIK